MRRNVNPKHLAYKLRKFKFNKFRLNKSKSTRFKYNRYSFNRYLRFAKFRTSLKSNFVSGPFSRKQHPRLKKYLVSKPVRWSPSYFRIACGLLNKFILGKCGLSTIKWSRGRKHRYIKNMRRRIYLKLKRSRRKPYKSSWLAKSKFAGRLSPSLPSTRPGVYRRTPIRVAMRHLYVSRFLGAHGDLIAEHSALRLNISRSLTTNFLSYRPNELSFKSNKETYLFNKGVYLRKRLNFFKVGCLKDWQEERFKLVRKYSPQANLKSRLRFLYRKLRPGNFKKMRSVKMKFGGVHYSKARIVIRKVLSVNFLKS